MKTTILLGLLTGLDNLQVTPALGVLNMTSRRRLKWAIAFGLTEALMPLAGLAIGSSLHLSSQGWADKIGPVTLLLCGLAVLIMASRKWNVTAVASSKWAMVVLPLSLGIDNFFAGMGAGANGAPVIASAVIVGGISTLMALGGLFAGQFVRSFLPRSPELFAGSFLLALGICGFF